MSSPRANLLQDLDMAMRRASSQTVLFSQAVASRLGLHPTDLGTLDILTREGRLTAGRLAELTGLSTAATTSLIDRLERSGFARRVRDPVDRRKVFVEVDEDRAIRDILPLYAAFSEALARMSRARWKSCTRFTVQCWTKHSLRRRICPGRKPATPCHYCRPTWRRRN